MNKYIQNIFTEISDNGITYCHFKSNNNLIPAAQGVDDLDILVRTGDLNKFIKILNRNGFKLASDRNSVSSPFVYHYFSSDPSSGLLIHFHVYYKLVTGGSILKNHWIQLENLFLSNTLKDAETGIYIPKPEIDLILLVIRKYLEQKSLIEHYLFIKDLPNIQSEVNWLVERICFSNLQDIFEKTFPNIDFSIFIDCLNNLIHKSSIYKRLKLAFKFNKYFPSKVYNSLYASFLRSFIFFLVILKSKIGYKRKDRWLYPGGVVIAFTGSEASGKSTISRSIYNWLSERFDVHHFHLGKPKKNWRTYLFWKLINLYVFIKKIFFKNRSKSSISSKDSQNIPHPFVCILDSIDRKHTILKIIKLKMQGAIILTDRYPSRKVGGLDGPRIPVNYKYRFLHKYEINNYSSMIEPDLAFRMVADLNITLKRNNLRNNPEPDEFVRNRYLLAKEINFKNIDVIDIDTSQNLDDSITEVQNHIWSYDDLK